MSLGFHAETKFQDKKKRGFTLSPSLNIVNGEGWLKDLGFINIHKGSK
jgi:hypothetical protein